MNQQIFDSQDFSGIDQKIERLKRKLDRHGFPSTSVDRENYPIINTMLNEMILCKVKSPHQLKDVSDIKESINGLERANTKLRSDNTALEKEIKKIQTMIRERKAKALHIPPSCKNDYKFLYQRQVKIRTQMVEKYNQLVQQHNTMLCKTGLLSQEQTSGKSLPQKEDLIPQKHYEEAKRMKQINQELFEKIEQLKKNLHQYNMNLNRIHTRISTTNLNIDQIAELSTIQTLQQEKGAINAQLESILRAMKSHERKAILSRKTFTLFQKTDSNPTTSMLKTKGSTV